MRRALNVGFFVCVIACAVALYVRLRQRPPAPVPTPRALARALEPVTAPSPAPRLAPPRPLDAGAPVKHTVAPSEQMLMQQIRALVKTEPQRAEALAREARRRFPDGADADERDALLVDALINQQRIGAARDETYYYFDHHPDGRFGEHLAMMTGVRPRPGRPGP